MDTWIKVACGCNTGRIRKNNEDNFYFNGDILPIDNSGLETALYARYKYRKDFLIFGVFDGMGGEEDGQIASFFSAGILQELCATTKLSEDEMIPFLERAIAKMNQSVYQEAKKRFNRMGSTAAILCFSGENVYKCNIGDSRMFRLRKGDLIQISKDHTDEEFLLLRGITNRKPRLTQCIGVDPEEMMIEPYIDSDKWVSGDKYLICSDGLTDMVKAEVIKEILRAEEDVKECVECLVNAALKNGGRDNVTVIVVALY